MPKFHGQPLIPSYDQKISYDANNRQEYIGYAIPGALTSEAKWTIYKLEYDSDGRMITRRHANSKDNLDLEWDEKANYEYVDI